MLGRQVQQALRVYTTHATFWVWVFVWSVWHLGTLLMRPSGDELGLSFLAVAHGMLGFEIGQTLAAQFANVRARLLPGFARAHLIAAGGLVTVAFATVLLIGGLLRLPVFGALNLSAAAMGLAILLPLNTGRAKYGSWLVFGMVVLFVWASGSPWFNIHLADLRFHAALGGIGLVAMIAAAFRLVRLSEDSPGYSAISSGFDWDAERDTPAKRQRSEWAKEAASFPRHPTLRDIGFSTAFRWLPRPGRWRRIILRQLAHGAPVLFFLPHQFAAPLLFLWLMPVCGFSNDSHFDQFVLCMWPLIVIISSLHSWSIRVDHLARESLLPVARKDFVHELYLVHTLEMAVAAVGHCMVIVVGLALLQRNLPIRFVSAWLALTITQHLVAYNLMFWLNSVRPSCVAAVVTVIVSCVVLPGATAVILAETTIAASWREGTVAMLVLAVVAVIASIGLHRLAVRRWCRIDLEWNR